MSALQILLFPLTMISKRVQDGEHVDMRTKLEAVEFAAARVH